MKYEVLILFNKLLLVFCGWGGENQSTALVFKFY